MPLSFFDFQRSIKMTARTMIDLTPSWGEFGLMYARLAESGECDAVRTLRTELVKAMAAAQALLELGDSLSPSQIALRDRVLRREMNGQMASSARAPTEPTCAEG